jgi:hypothetical protein
MMAKERRESGVSLRRHSAAGVNEIGPSVFAENAHGGQAQHTIDTMLNNVANSSLFSYRRKSAIPSSAAT